MQSITPIFLCERQLKSCAELLTAGTVVLCHEGYFCTFGWKQRNTSLKFVAIKKWLTFSIYVLVYNYSSSLCES